MLAEIRLPELGLDAAKEMFVSLWFVHPGEEVLEGDRVVEILVDFATFDVSAPSSGTLQKIAFREDQAVKPGDVLGYIEAE